MPTGYTADIKDGISFSTFALNCARAFGACMSLRDEPASTPIPDAFEPSPYHETQLTRVREDLAKLEALTPEEADSRASEAWHEAENRRLQQLDEIHRQKAAYEAMLAKVKAWTPPTPDHAELRRFMQTQIEDSLGFDCDTGYYGKPEPQLTGEVWRKGQVSYLTRQVEYHTKNQAQDVSRAAKQTAWVKALRESLKE